MPNIVRSPARQPSSRTKLLVVRQPARRVRRREPPSRTPLRLAIGVITVVGGIVLVWLMGHLGFRLGFAPKMGVPDLLGEPGQGLATGALMLIRSPLMIFRAGVARPEWLMLGFALIAIPAAGLSAARPVTPGGPKQPLAAVTFSAAGAVTAGLNGIALLWWTVCPVRGEMLGPLPFLPGTAEGWYAQLQTVAGLDVLAVIVAGLWVVLVLRLAVPLWLRAMAATVSFFTLVVVIVAMSLSGATCAQVAAPRSMCLPGDAREGWHLLLGSTEHHMVTLSIRDRHTAVELRNYPDIVAVQGTRSIIDFLRDNAPEE